MFKISGDIVEMWPGGPLRRFSETRTSGGWTPYSSPLMTGYAGPYVCAVCGADATQGVYGPSPNGYRCAKCTSQVARRKVPRIDGRE